MVALKAQSKKMKKSFREGALERILKTESFETLFPFSQKNLELFFSGL